jgi:hypothetical protein
MNIYFRRPWNGIDDQSMEEAKYWCKLKQFHVSPIVKMFYQFVSCAYRDDFNMENVELRCS